jgi:hypothetical protein
MAAGAAPPQEAPLPPPPHHPVRLRVLDDRRRSRLTVLLRLLLSIPHWLWLMLWGFAFYGVVFFNWFATLFGGRSERDVHDFTGRFLRYNAHVYAYVGLLANPFPPFGGRPRAYPVDLEFDPPERQSRWKTGFRLLLALPAFVFANVLSLVMQIVAVVGWFACLILGRMPRGLRDLGAYCLRYQMQTYAYMALLTPRYPSLSAGLLLAEAA